MICCLPRCGEPAYTMLAGYALCRRDYDGAVELLAHLSFDSMQLDAFLFGEILRGARWLQEQSAKWRDEDISREEEPVEA